MARRPLEDTEVETGGRLSELNAEKLQCLTPGADPPRTAGATAQVKCSRDTETDPREDMNSFMW